MMGYGGAFAVPFTFSLSGLSNGDGGVIVQHVVIKMIVYDGGGKRIRYVNNVSDNGVDYWEAWIVPPNKQDSLSLTMTNGTKSLFIANPQDTINGKLVALESPTMICLTYERGPLMVVEMNTITHQGFTLFVARLTTLTASPRAVLPLCHWVLRSIKGLDLGPRSSSQHGQLTTLSFFNRLSKQPVERITFRRPITI